MGFGFSLSYFATRTVSTKGIFNVATDFYVGITITRLIVRYVVRVSVVVGYGMDPTVSGHTYKTTVSFVSLKIGSVYATAIYYVGVVGGVVSNPTTTVSRFKRSH